ncbi:PAS domain S-box protein [Bacteroidota bacterium]
MKKAREEARQQVVEMEKAKKRIEITLQESPDAILTFDQNGVIRFFNKAAQNIWGVDKDAVIGRNIKKIFPEENYSNQFVNSLLDTKSEKIVGQRNEIVVSNIKGEEKKVIALLTKIQIEEEITYTAFFQII